MLMLILTLTQLCLEAGAAPAALSISQPAAPAAPFPWWMPLLSQELPRTSTGRTDFLWRVLVFSVEGPIFYCISRLLSSLHYSLPEMSNVSGLWVALLPGFQ